MRCDSEENLSVNDISVGVVAEGLVRSHPLAALCDDLPQPSIADRLVRERVHLTVQGQIAVGM